MSALPRYPEYRTTALSYARELPAHWDERPNVRLFALRKERGRPEMPILEVSIRSGVAVRDMESGDRKQVMSDLELYQRACPGDIAYNTMRMWQGAVGCVPTEGLVSPAYVIVRPQPTVNSEFYARLFRTPEYLGEISRYSHGIVLDRNRLYWDSFKQISSVLPPREEQDAIVRFLEEKERDIEHYLATKRKMIEVLNDRLTTMIDRLAAPKDVPSDWRADRFKRHVGYQEGPGIMAADFRDTGVPLLRISCLASERASLSGCNHLDPEMVKRRWDHFRVRPGDYLLSCSASTGTVSIASEEVVGAIPYTGILRLWKRSGDINMEYVRWFMQTRDFRDQIAAHQSGVGLQHFGPTHLGRFTMLVPPQGVQRSIAESLRNQSSETRKAIGAIEQEIAAMQEYRTRLIADAVTGQIDVRRLG